MARRGTSVYRASFRGAGRVAAQFDADKRAIQDAIIAELRTFGAEAQSIMVAAAPEDTGELHERIDVVPFFGRASRPRVSIRVRPDLEGHEGDDITDFDYLKATRFGHKPGDPIVPVEARVLKVHHAGHRNAAIFDFRMAVPRARVPVDWVAVGAERCARASAIAERRLGRRIATRILR